MSNNTPGPDHMAPSTPIKVTVSNFLSTAKKAVLAFLVSGVAGGLAPALQNFDFSNLTWGNLWAGLGSGLLGSVVVYVARNKASSLGLPPEMEAALEAIIVKHLGTLERNITPKLAVQAPPSAELPPVEPPAPKKRPPTAGKAKPIPPITG